MRRNGSASLWDLGDGVLCLEFHTKMNAIDPGIIALAAEAIALAPIARSWSTTRASGSGSARTWRRAPVRQHRAVGRPRPRDPRPARTRSRRSRTRRSRSSARRPGWRSAAAARSCCTATRSRRTPSRTSGWSRSGVGIVPGWGGCLRLRRSGWPRARRTGRWRRCRRRSRRSAWRRSRRSAAEARELGFLRAGRPDHDEPRPRARRRARVAPRARRRLRAAGAGRAALPGPSGAAALVLGVASQALAGRALPHDRVVARRARARADRRRRRSHRARARAARLRPRARGGRRAACTPSRRCCAWSTCCTDRRSRCRELRSLDDVRFLLRDVLGEAEMPYDDVLDGRRRRFCRERARAAERARRRRGLPRWSTATSRTPGRLPRGVRGVREGGWAG